MTTYNFKHYDASNPDKPKVCQNDDTTLDIVGGKLTVKDSGVATAKIADNAATSAKIAHNAVTVDQLANDAVDTAAIAANAVVAAKIAHNAVTVDQLADNAVDTAAIANLAVTDAKIAASTITDGKLATPYIKADGSRPFTADQSMNSHKITNLTDGAADGDAVNYSQLQSVVSQGKHWKEVVLHNSQLGATGLFAANILQLSANLQAGDSISIHDGTTAQTLVAGTDFTVGAAINDTLTALKTAINAGSKAVSETETIASIDPTNNILFIRQDTVGEATRVYGNAAAATRIKIIDPTSVVYEGVAANLVALPTADPAATNFGFSKTTAQLIVNESRSARNNDFSYTWDNDSSTWHATSVGAIPLGSASVAGKVQIHDGIAVSAGSISADVDTAKGLNLEGTSPNKKIITKVDTTTIGFDGSGNLQLIDNCITAAKIQPNAVAASELANDAVDTDAIAANAVTSAKIAHNAVGSDQIAENAVGASEIAGNVVADAHIANNTISGAKIVDNGISSTQIAHNAVTANQLANDAVDTAAIVDANVTEAKLAAAVVAKLGGTSFSAVAGENLAQGAVVYLKDSDGKAYEAQANASASCDGQLYLVEAAVVASASGSLVNGGLRTNYIMETAQSFDTTKPLYLSAAEKGKMTHVPPTLTATNVVYRVGYATDTLGEWQMDTQPIISM